jgi:hypothetical protein
MAHHRSPKHPHGKANLGRPVRDRETMVPAHSFAQRLQHRFNLPARLLRTSWLTVRPTHWMVSAQDQHCITAGCMQQPHSTSSSSDTRAPRVQQ